MYLNRFAYDPAVFFFLYPIRIHLIRDIFKETYELSKTSLYEWSEVLENI